MSVVKKSFRYGEREVTLETGRIARQANAAVLASMDDTVVLCTVACNDDGVERDFFPLTVNYQEKSYAAGKIPGGFFKREGRPTEKETLISRLIDRPIRPLFPKSFTHEVQVICTVVSLNNQVDADIISMIGSSAALMISGIPFQGPIGAAKIGFIDEKYVLNPDNTQMQNSKLDLVVAGTKDGVLMVESEAKVLTEEQMLGAVSFGHDEMQNLIKEIENFANEAGIKEYKVEDKTDPIYEELDKEIRSIYAQEIESAFKISDKIERNGKLNEILNNAIEKLDDDDETKTDMINNSIHSLQKDIVRNSILDGNPRIDGRDTKQLEIYL